MKLLFIILATFLFLTSFSQSRELTILIENVESLTSAPPDSIEIELTNQGYAAMGEQLTIRTEQTNNRVSLLNILNIKSDSTTLKIYFNKHGFAEIGHLNYLDSDTLTILNFTVYPDCEQKGKWFRKTVFDNDTEGETDYLNYIEEVKSEFDSEENKCLVPESFNLTINGIQYQSEVEKQTTPGLVTTGHGYTNKFWFGGKKYFHFTEVELKLFRKVRFEIK